jgi:hypothetical protein
MSPTATVKILGVVGAMSAAYKRPVTAAHVAYWPLLARVIPKPVKAVVAMGLTPRFPVMAVVPVVDTPALDKIT